MTGARPAIWRRWIGWCGRCGASPGVHRVCCYGWRLIKIIALLVFAAWTIGLPGSWTLRRLGLTVAPYTAEVRRITANPMHGLVLHGITLATDRPGDGTIRAERLALRPAWPDLLRGRLRIRHMEVSDGLLTLPCQPAPIELDALHLTLTTENDETRVELATRTDAGTFVEATGRIVLPAAPPAAPKSPPRPPSPASLAPRIHAWQHALIDLPPWFNNLRRLQGELGLTDAPRARIAFVLHTDRPRDLQAAIAAEWPPFTWRGQAFDRLTVDVLIARQTLSITRAELRQGTNRLHAAGDYQIPADQFQLHLYSDLPAPAVAALVPARHHRLLTRRGVVLEGPLHAEGWIGPCPLADVPTQWTGWLKATDARLNDLPLESAFVSLKRDGPVLAIQDVQLVGGTGPGRGPLDGELNLDFARRTLDGRINLGIELRQFHAVLPPGLQRVADMFITTNRPVRFTGRFRQNLDDPRSLVVEGPITGEHIAFRTVPLEACSVSLVYSNNRVILNPFLARRPGGEAVGALDLDFTRQRFDLDLDITANPKDFAPMLGPKTAAHFNPFVFSDDVRARVVGRVDAATDRETDLHVTLSGRRIGIPDRTFDHVSAQARRTPGHLAISNLVGSLGGGTVTGTVAITHHRGAPDDVTLNLVVDRVPLRTLVALRTPAFTNAIEGLVYGQATARGLFPDPPGWTNVTGTGTLRIEDGRLLRIPVFGGLSTLLGKIYPGLGFSEQNRLEADLRFANGAVHTDNLVLAGSLITLNADGRLHWERGWNLYVRVHPFREGTLASAVRLVTLPLSMLLEFKLTGPFEQPAWEAVNLPL